MRIRVWFASSLVAAFGVVSPAFFTAQAADTDQGKKEKVVKTKSGLQYVDLKRGTGKAAARGDIVKVDYIGRLKDGTKFDSSRDRKKPIWFKLGNRDVMPGWEQGLMGMKEGGKRKLIIPPELAYGPAGYKPKEKGIRIPANATLIYEIELRKVVKSED
jgi:peptidylprolyl isomerase